MIIEYTSSTLLKDLYNGLFLREILVKDAKFYRGLVEDCSTSNSVLLQNNRI